LKILWLCLQKPPQPAGSPQQTRAQKSSLLHVALVDDEKRGGVCPYQLLKKQNKQKLDLLK
jgi:hypothetical protein